MKPDSLVGYWLECDIKIPKKLHKKTAFQNFPPLPESKVITFKDLSPKQKKLLIKKIGKKQAKNYKSKKLISSLLTKKGYKANYLTIKQALEFGCKLLKVHKVISFTQEPFSREFLQMMTLRRKNAKSKLEERTCKDIANQLYGKSCEKVKDRRKVIFVKSYWYFNRLQNLSGYRGHKVISPTLVLVYMTATKVTLNKPLQIGASILEISKVSVLYIVNTIFFKDIKFFHLYGHGNIF